MKENAILDKSKKFAIKIIKLGRFLTETKREFILSKQIIKSGTSVGANVKEAQQAQSRADFISKMSIALKEASETEYWLELLYESEYISEEQFNDLYNNAKELIKILTSIIRTTKEK